jgi:hypothetical protein
MQHSEAVQYSSYVKESGLHGPVIFWHRCVCRTGNVDGYRRNRLSGNVVDRGVDGERKIDDMQDRGRAEETGRFLDLLHVLSTA